MELDDFPLGGRGCQVWMELSRDWLARQWRHCIDCPAHAAPRGPSKISLSFFLLLSSPSLTLSSTFFPQPLSFFSIPLRRLFCSAEICLEGGCFAKGMDEILARICLTSTAPEHTNHLTLASSLPIFLRVTRSKHASIFEIHSRDPPTRTFVPFLSLSNGSESPPWSWWTSRSGFFF